MSGFGGEVAFRRLMTWVAADGARGMKVTWLPREILETERWRVTLYSLRSDRHPIERDGSCLSEVVDVALDLSGLKPSGTTHFLTTEEALGLEGLENFGRSRHASWSVRWYGPPTFYASGKHSRGWTVKYGFSNQAWTGAYLVEPITNLIIKKIKG